MPPPSTPEIHPEQPPVVPTPPDLLVAQVPAVPPESAVSRGPLQRLGALFPGGQFVRYLLVGIFNTVFGYTSYLVAVKLLSGIFPARLLSITAIAASVVSTPLNITVAFLGYKFFVFRTQGNYLREWLKCFAVYGTGMIPSLVALGALTRLLQGLLHKHAPTLHHVLAAAEAHLSGRPLTLLQSSAHSRGLAADLAGLVVIALSTVYSFIGHKKITFARKAAPAPAAVPPSAA